MLLNVVIISYTDIQRTLFWLMMMMMIFYAVVVLKPGAMILCVKQYDDIVLIVRILWLMMKYWLEGRNEGCGDNYWR
jgi:hypothetical protein